MLPAHEACRWPTRVSSLPKESLRCLSGGSATNSAGRLADYIAKVNLITKVLDFVKSGRLATVREGGIVRYEYKIVEAKTQADIERTMNDLAQAGYRLVSFFITDRGIMRGQGAFKAVMERQLG